MDMKEFQIPVPWGHVAAIAYGEECNPLVLVVHGLWDNAGAFHQLIPLLPKSNYYVLIDLPGHGKSSHFPIYRNIYMVDFVITYKYVLDYLNRKRYTFLVHSFGAHIGQLFAQLYPEYVEKIIVLDCVTAYPITVHNFKQNITSNIQKAIYTNQKICGGLKQPTYTYEKCLEKLFAQRVYSSLAKSSAKALLERWLVPVDENKFKFSLDPRTHSYFSMIYSMEFLLDTLEHCPIKCPILYVIASKSISTTIYFNQYLKALQKANNRCFVVQVDGDHDLPTNNFDTIAPLISTFLIHKFSKL